VRVIAGRLRGRTIQAPAGRETRPTSDRVRESLFNLLGSIPRGAEVLDLFAGSGALGIEAMSRGAGRATFVEARPDALRVLRRNLESLGLTAATVVRRADASSAGAFSGGPFDVVFADPPYSDGLAAQIVRGAEGALAPGAILALEHAATEAPPEPPETLALWKSRRYGGTCVTLYVRAEEEES
jgi:16S rRNA (guanine966-N2)-methyltransferase